MKSEAFLCLGGRSEHTVVSVKNVWQPAIARREHRLSIVLLSLLSINIFVITSVVSFCWFLLIH